MLLVLMRQHKTAVVFESDLKALTKTKMGFAAVKRDVHTMLKDGRVAIARGPGTRVGWTVVA